ncbi:hypothetical protein ZWY2020_029372 [Hordeum vulgare]|nr:hypothetical protein ZWY2020_029372 [Hordeum vulgare]
MSDGSVPPRAAREKTVERRKKRMIKNRESAARSRARKQAYTDELENKISRLEEENQQLRSYKAFEPVVHCVPQEPKNQLRRRTRPASDHHLVNSTSGEVPSTKLAKFVTDYSGKHLARKY